LQKHFNIFSCYFYSFYSEHDTEIRIPLQLELQFPSEESRRQLQQIIADQLMIEKVIKLELNYARNVLINEYDIQQCPKCSTIIYREKCNLSEMKCKTLCPICEHMFCWSCAGKWCDDQSLYYCGHVNCAISFIQQTIGMLQNCPTKEIGDISNVPETRACPKCSMLITHDTACKHMNCFGCKTDFCFVCMKMKDESGSWQCGGYDDACEIAPRQTSKDLPSHGLSRAVPIQLKF
jgi:hypothetical protein